MRKSFDAIVNIKFIFSGNLEAEAQVEPVLADIVPWRLRGRVTVPVDDLLKKGPDHLQGQTVSRAKALKMERRTFGQCGEGQLPLNLNRLNVPAPQVFKELGF